MLYLLVYIFWLSSLCFSSTRHMCLRRSCDWLSFVSSDTCVSAGFALCETLGGITFDFQLTFLLPIFRQALCLRSEHTCDRTPCRAACDITVISPLISVFLGRLRLLNSSCSVWQRKKSSIFSSHFTTRYIHRLPLHILSLNFDCIC